jgi:hypothetical protein
VQNIEIVKTFESKSDVDERTPDSLLLKDRSSLLVVHNLLVKISVVKKFHNNAEWLESYQRELASMKECLYPTI